MSSPRLRHVAAINPATPAFDRLSDDAEVTFLPLEAVWPKDGLDISRTRPKKAVASGYTRYADGDVVVPKITPTFEADRSTIARAPHHGVGAGTTELHTVRVSHSAEPRYVDYLLSSTHFLQGGKAEMTGVAGQQRVPDEWIRDFPVPVIDLRHQRAIANLLDAETARIDALVETKRRLFDAVHAKFLDSVDVSTSRGPMTSLRRVIKLRTSGPRGWSARIVEGGVPFVRSGNLVRDDIELSLDEMAYVPLDKSAEALRSRIATDDVLVGITGANTAWVAVSNASTVGGHVSQHVALLRPSQVTGRWLAYCLFAPSTRRALLESQYGGTKQQLGLDELAELSIAVPSIEDQRHRVNHLNSLRTATVEARQAVARSIDLLQERRRALITSAVTGEMAVPGVEAA